MQNNLKILFFLFSFFFTTNAFANFRKGSLEGPYITLSGGILQWDWDVNQRTKVEEGKPWEPNISLGFGWNIIDWLAPEMNLSFLTDGNKGRREHLAAIDVGFAFTPLIKPFLQSQKWKILPFVKPFFGFQLASLPSDPNATGRITDTAFGTGVGGGLRFLFNQYLFFGFEVNESFFFHHNKRQNLNPGGDTLIYEGGMKKQFQSSLMVGVHF